MEKIFRLGIIGATGTARKRILPALDGSEVCRPVAIQSRNIDANDEIAELFEIDASYSGVDDLLTHPGIDGVYIATPPFLHMQQIELALMRGLHVLVEKPLCISITEAERILEMTQKSDALVAVAHHLRMHPAIPWIQSMVGEGRLLGKVKYVNMVWVYKLDRNARNALWKLNPSRNPGGVMDDVGIHLIDTAQALFGQPEDASSTARMSEGGVRHSVCGCLHYKDFDVSLFCSWDAPKQANNLNIWCEKGYLCVNNLFVDSMAPHGKIVKPDGSCSEVEFKERDLYGLEIEEFCLAAQKSRRVLTSVENAVEALKLSRRMLSKTC